MAAFSTNCHLSKRCRGMTPAEPCCVYLTIAIFGLNFYEVALLKGEMRSRKVYNWMSDSLVVGVSLLCCLRCRDISKLWKERCVSFGSC
ncbi:hypothetical protein NC652_014976 [Populus alba x Populus x berolinensis]|nr:hypothetical protein NC652_014973 [Populus alba x Populus x berolinensis]KAJ6931646.1 hypothetical protein NC652_014976 [Populus alba x Populus x berolinensis]